MGASLFSVLLAFPGSHPGLSDFPLVLACVSLAVVTGFVSLLPGGLGVRELVMVPLLGGLVGPVTAVAAAVVLRLVWLVAELGLAFLLQWIRSGRAQQKNMVLS